MLETIYEVDENSTPEIENDSTRFLEQPSRLPYYICCCMIVGCFTALSLIIAVSLNPYLLSKHSIQKNSKSTLKIPIHSDDKLTIAIDLINHLNIFAHHPKQINERLGLQPNTLTFSTSTISDLSTDQQNQRDILWIYSHLKYPPSCLPNHQCRNHFNSKLKTSFTELSSLLNSIELQSYHDKRIQLDWCNFIENTTRAVLVSLVSVITMNQSTIESTIAKDRIHCGNLDPNILLSKAIDPIKQNDHSEDEEIGKQYGPIGSNKEHNLTPNHPLKTKIRCPSDTDTRVLLAWNFY